MTGSIWKAWCKFWFESDGSNQMRVFRPLFALLLISCYCVRSMDLEFFFGPDGMMRPGLLSELMPMQYRPSLFEIFPSSAAIWIGDAVLLGSLALLAVGWVPRVAAALALVMHLSFLHRNMSINYGVDMIACLYLLYLCFAQYRPGPRDSLGFQLGSISYRLCQIQVCVIYAYSGLHKLQGLAWWKGDGVWNVLANFEIARFDFTWTAQFPAVLMAMSFVSLLWEIYFPVLVWIRPVRIPLLIFGVLFHLGIGFALGLPFFAGLMMILYCLFFDAEQSLAVESFFKKLLKTA